MKKEIYYWIAFIVIVLAIALYLRFYNAASYNVALSFSSNSSLSSLSYPYQELHLQVLVNNTGTTTVSDMGIDVLLNGNTTYVYGVTVPPGKTAVIKLNYTPILPGAYNFTAVADPNNFYNLVNRGTAKTSYTAVVTPEDKPASYAFIPSNGIVSTGAVSMDCIEQDGLNCPGFLYYLYFESNYNLTQFNITRYMPGLNSFFEPFLFTVSSAVANINVTYANYTNGNSVYSIWLRGYLSTSIVATGAAGDNLSTSTESIDGQNVTIVNLKDNESLCSWYAGGWVKSVASDGKGSCVALLQSNQTRLSGPVSAGIPANDPFGNSTVIATADTVHGNSSTVAYSALLDNTTFAYTSATTNSFVDDVCYGIVTTLDNHTYCSSYVFPRNGSIGPDYYLIATTGVFGKYNLTSFLRVNNTQVPIQAELSTELLNRLNLMGPSSQFISGISASCEFNESFPCGDVNFTNSSVSLRIESNVTAPLKLTSVGCYLNPPISTTKLNISLVRNSTANLTLKCYNYGVATSSLPYGFAFHVQLNYTIGNQTKQIIGLLT